MIQMHEAGIQRETFDCPSQFLSCYCVDIFFPHMGRCILLDGAISTLIGLLPRLGMTFEDVTVVVAASVGDQCLIGCIKKRSPMGSSPG